MSPSLTRIVVFLAVVLGIVAGVHFYLWARLVRDTSLPSPWRPWVTGALVGLAVLLPLPLVLARLLPVSSARLSRVARLSVDGLHVLALRTASGR